MVIAASVVFETVPVSTSKIRPAPLPKYQWEASAWANPIVLISMRLTNNLILID